MKKFVSIMLISVISITTCCSGLSVVAADKALASTLEPLYSDYNVTVNNQPKAVTNIPISNFTTDLDYTVKTNQSAIVTFDMGDSKWKNIYSNDFNSGEVWSSSYKSSLIANVDGKIMLKADANIQKYVETDPIVQNVGDFELSFDVISVAHVWTYARWFLRGGDYIIFISGENAANSLKLEDGSKPYLYFENTKTKKKVYYTKEILTGKNVRIVSVGKKVQIYVNDNLVIDYECTDAAYTPATVLDANKKYNIKIIRDAGNVIVKANGNEILETAIAFPYNKDDVSLWNGLIGLASQGEDTIERVAIYDSTNIDLSNGYALISPLEDAVKDEFTLEGIGTWSGSALNGDTTYNITSDNTFSVSSDTRTNSYVTVNDILKKDYSDVYISFDIKGSRNNNSRDYIYFAGYTIEFRIYNVGTTTPITVKNASGVSLTVDETYSYHAQTYYTVELIKKGPRFEAYYYPQGGERNLLCSDDNCTETAVNFGLWKLQGTVSFDNFTVYDAVPTGYKKIISLSDNSLYVRTTDGIGAIPIGTTVREVKANIINGDVVDINRNGKKLSDTDIVLTGDYITSTEHEAFKWNIGTLGDLNGDGVINNDDLDIAKTAKGNTTNNTAALAGADIDQSGIIDDSDTELLSNMISENNTSMTYVKRSIVGDALLLYGKNIGRQYYEQNIGVNFEWNAANITVGGYMQGDVTVTINYDIGDESAEAGIIVYIDGDASSYKLINLKTGTNTYTVAEALEAGYHTVKIAKNNASVSSAFYMEAIGLTGTLQKVADKQRKIEFLGDSITAGHGVQLDSNLSGSEWLRYVHYSFASVAARELDADYYCMANSGWTVSRELKPTQSINNIYELATYKRTPNLTYDFSWNPDLVVIGLGTNDHYALDSQRKTLAENGDDTTVFDYEAAEKSLKAEVTVMLDKVRSNNPDAKIIWAFGAMVYGMTGPDGRKIGDWIKDAVEAYNETDGKVMFYRLMQSTNGGQGHPDAIGSKYIGEKFAEAAAEFMGWEYSPNILDYSYGEMINSYDFDDGTTQGITANNLSYAYNTDNRLMIKSQTDLYAYSSAFAQNSHLDTYEMTLNWDHESSSEYSRMILVLRSPDSSLSNAIYLTVLGENLATVNNSFNPLKYTSNNVQLVATKNGDITELSSLQIADIFDGKNKNINVRMGINWLEVTIWNVGEEKPANPTFSVPISEDVAPAYGDIFEQGRNSNDIYDNINISYGVVVDLPGDLDRTKTLNAVDIICMRRLIFGYANEINIDNFAADVNQDSNIDIRDIVALKKAAS